MLVSTKCKFCGKEIRYDTEKKRTVENEDDKRIHVCDSRIVSCKFCGKLIYFSIKKDSAGKSQPFDAETQTKHKCKKVN